MGKNHVYVLSQLVGWSAYILVGFFLNQMAGVPFDRELIISHLTAFFLGLVISHGYREIILRNDWLKLGIKKMIPRFVFGSIFMSTIFEICYVGITELVLGGALLRDFNTIIQDMASWIILFLSWSLIYFFYHFFKNYKAEEIKNLKWEASKNEIELNKLKSQLNPHFMFNSMNTIRALIDENPKTAKLAVTQLSNILRSNLLMGRQKLIPLEQEMKLVQDYLAVEGYRYEERLKFDLDVSPMANGVLIPPLMVQTLVENGIKHGISKLPQGGELHLNAIDNETTMKITIINSGQYSDKITSETGFGLANTIERLKLLYGDSATMNIQNLDENRVITEIEVPKNIEL